MMLPAFVVFSQRRLGPIWRHLRNVELVTLVLILCVAGGVWAFAELADEVVEGATESFDRTVLMAFHSTGNPEDPAGPEELEQIARDVTSLGGYSVLVLVVLASTGFLFLRKQHRAALFLLAAVLGGWGVSLVMKETFSRERPDLVPHGDVADSASFPSGHSMLSAVVYLTLGALLARVQPHRRLKVYLLGLALLLTLMIGTTRVYLAVHWPTDVLAGWAAGATWALFCWLVLRWLQRRGRVEPERSMSDVESAAPERGKEAVKT